MSKPLVPVVFVPWTESERGWGCRPDGFSLHLSQAAFEAHMKAHRAQMPKEVPYEYSRPEKPQILDVHADVHAMLSAKHAEGIMGVYGDRDEEAELRAGRDPWGGATVSVWIVGADGKRVRDSVTKTQLRSAQSRARALKGLGIQTAIVDDASGEDLPPA